MGCLQETARLRRIVSWRVGRGLLVVVHHGRRYRAIRRLPETIDDRLDEGIAVDRQGDAAPHLQAEPLGVELQVVDALDQQPVEGETGVALHSTQLWTR